MMKSILFAAAAASLLFAAAGSAGAATTFTAGAAAPEAGYMVIDKFDTATGLTGSGYLLTTNHDGNGAPPANSIPYDTNYLSVMGGGSAAISFAALTSHAVHAFEFDWGSIDGYNTLVIHGSAGDMTVVPGTASFPNAANGNQVSPGTNGLFKVVGAAHQTFSGLTLTSSGNSFEVDNLSIPVPEPTTWAMMLMGLGAVGLALRGRRKDAVVFA